MIAHARLLVLQALCIRPEQPREWHACPQAPSPCAPGAMHAKAMRRLSGALRQASSPASSTAPVLPPVPPQGLRGLGPGFAEQFLAKILTSTGDLGAEEVSKWITKAVAELAVSSQTDRQTNSAAPVLGSASAAALPFQFGEQQPTSSVPIAMDTEDDSIPAFGAAAGAASKANTGFPVSPFIFKSSGSQGTKAPAFSFSAAAPAAPAASATPGEGTVRNPQVDNSDSKTKL